MSPLGLYIHEGDGLNQSDSFFSTQDIFLKGFESRVRVVKSALVDLDREHKCAIIESGEVIPYDYLVLTPGLQDCTKRYLEKIGNIPNQILFAGSRQSMTQIDDVIKEAVRKGEKIIVYGNTMEALSSLNYIIDYHHASNNIDLILYKTMSRLLHENNKITDIVLEQLAKAGVNIKYGRKLKEIECDDKSNLSKVIFTYKGNFNK